MNTLFVLAGNGPCTNRGCEAILLSTVDLLGRRFPGARFVSSPEKQDRRCDRRLVRHPAIVHRPYTFPSRWSVDAFRRAVTKRIPRASPHPFAPFLRGAAAVLALGGDNFTLDYGDVLLRRQLALARFARSRGVPFVIWGASIGPFSADPDLERLTATELKEATLIAVRESLSQKYLASLGVEANVVRVADPAFLLEPSEPRHAGDLQPLLADRPVGINLSPLMQRYRPTWPDDALAIVRAIDRVVDAPLLLIPHVVWTGSDDHAFLASLAAALGKTRNAVTLLPPTLDSRELKWTIGRVRALVAARTHATIAAFSQAVPTLSIGYSQKAVGLNADLFGHVNWVVDVRDATADRVASRVRDLLSDGDDVRRILCATLERQMTLAASAADALRGVMA
jgi:polysaccharide pyruvyl transferase WcaK-like protein